MLRWLGAWAIPLCWACASAGASAEAPAAPTGPPAPVCPGRAPALALAREGDRVAVVSVQAAIDAYLRALELDPTNHEILWKLSRSYEKTQDWDALASTLARAAELAPEFANYWYRQGEALVERGRAGQRGAYATAKPVLSKCIEHDPNLAACHALLGEAELWTDDEQRAAESFTRAVQLAPTEARYYVPLADLYLMFKRDRDAKNVLEQGARLAEPNDVSRSAHYEIRLRLLRISQSGSRAEQLAALQAVEPLVGEGDVQASFILGSGYASLEPPESAMARRLLSAFVKRACRGSAASRFREQCELAADVLARLGP